MWAYPPQQAHATTQKNQASNNPVVEAPANNGQRVLRPEVTVKPYTPPKPTSNPKKNVHKRSGKKAQQSPAPKSTSAYSGRHYSKAEVEALIAYYSKLYGIDDYTPRCIAFHESGYNQFSKNKTSSASGVFQYLSGTWKATDEGKAGRSVFDADANVKAAVKYMASRKSTQPWSVRSKCPPISVIK